MAYHMKNSPINQGTAAKPSPARKASPMKAPVVTAALIGAGVSMLMGGVSAAQKAKDRKNLKKDKLLAVKNESLASTKEAVSKEVGGGEKIV